MADDSYRPRGVIQTLVWWKMSCCHGYQTFFFFLRQRYCLWKSACVEICVPWLWTNQPTAYSFMLFLLLFVGWNVFTSAWQVWGKNKNTHWQHHSVFAGERVYWSVLCLTHRLFCLYVLSGSEGAFLQEDTARLHMDPPPPPLIHLTHFSFLSHPRSFPHPSSCCSLSFSSSV